MMHYPLRLYLLMPGFLLGMLSTSAQSTAPASRQLEKIAHTIDADTAYLKITVKGKEVATEKDRFPGVAVGYFRSDKLVKISWWANNDGKSPATMQFYVKDAELIYIHETYHRYASADAATKKDDKALEQTFIGWYYFSNGKLFDYLSTGHDRTEVDWDFSLDLLRWYYQYASLLTRTYYEHRDHDIHPDN